jgi:hypothetical protein
MDRTGRENSTVEDHPAIPAISSVDVGILAYRRPGPRIEP